MLASLIRPTLLAARPALRQAPVAGFRPAFVRTLICKWSGRHKHRAVSMLTTSYCLATRYTIDHEWITLDSETGLGTIGVTEYAQQVS